MFIKESVIECDSEVLAVAFVKAVFVAAGSDGVGALAREQRVQTVHIDEVEGVTTVTVRHRDYLDKDNIAVTVRHNGG